MCLRCVQSTSGDTLHVKLGMSTVLGCAHFIVRLTSSLIRWRYFMLRCTRLLSFRVQTSCSATHVFLCYVAHSTSFVVTFAHIFCTLVYALHVSWTRLLHFGVHCTYFMFGWTPVLGCAHFVLRCTRLLYFSLHTSFYMLCSTRLLSASWPEEKRNAGALANRKTIHKTQDFVRVFNKRRNKGCGQIPKDLKFQGYHHD